VVWAFASLHAAYPASVRAAPRFERFAQNQPLVWLFVLIHIFPERKTVAVVAQISPRVIAAPLGSGHAVVVKELHALGPDHRGLQFDGQTGLPDFGVTLHFFGLTSLQDRASNMHQPRSRCARQVPLRQIPRCCQKGLRPKVGMVQREISQKAQSMASPHDRNPVAVNSGQLNSCTIALTRTHDGPRAGGHERAQFNWRLRPGIAVWLGAHCSAIDHAYRHSLHPVPELTPDLVGKADVVQG